MPLDHFQNMIAAFLWRVGSPVSTKEIVQAFRPPFEGKVSEETVITSLTGNKEFIYIIGAGWTLKEGTSTKNQRILMEIYEFLHDMKSGVGMDWDKFKAKYNSCPKSEFLNYLESIIKTVHTTNMSKILKLAEITNIAEQLDFSQID